LVAQVVGGGGEQVAQAEVERTAVLHDVRLAALVDDLLLELPLLLVGDPDGGAQIVEEQEQARLVLAAELGRRRGQLRLAHAECPQDGSASALALGRDRATSALRGVGGPVLRLFERLLRRLGLRRPWDRRGGSALRLVLRRGKGIGSGARRVGLRLRGLVEEPRSARRTRDGGLGGAGGGGRGRTAWGARRA